jgi:signal transduction histidine kinase
MKLRRKLLFVFALTVFISVGAVAWLVSYLARRTFEKVDQQRSSALVEKFMREFYRQGETLQRRVETIAHGEIALRMAMGLGQGPPDYAAYLNEARNAAEAQQLDFLDFIDDQGTILSSAEWPAKFGYKSAFAGNKTHSPYFFQRTDFPDGPVLGLCAARNVTAGDKTLRVIGGKRINREFAASLEVPPGMRILLYESLGPGSDSPRVIDPFALSPPIGPLNVLIHQLQTGPGGNSALIHWSSNSADDEMVYAIPMLGADRQLLGAILIASSMRPYIELRHQIQFAALLVAGGGILLAIMLSAWAATRVTRPVEKLAQAAQRVAAGDWSTSVKLTSSDELRELADSFNQMTHELLEQRERLVQAERVAAWRELARRLAHELKNPLFPLQLTVENLIRARQQSPEEFDETFRESSSTLLGEIANLKAIVSRFSDFSKMPQPRFEPVQLNELVQENARLFQSQLTAPGRTPIQCRLEMDSSLEPIGADPELLHRALSNLTLNAMEAMPNGGTLTLRTRQDQSRVYLEVSDTGSGLTPEERERLFTPYFTTKPHGTGLGLAIVQSIISDHGGRITVRTKAGEGTTFSIELPRNADRLQRTEVVQTISG